MKFALLSLFIVSVMILVSGCGLFYEELGTSNTRAHSLGIKQSVVTKPHGSLTLQVEFSDMSYIDQITEEWHYHEGWEEEAPYVSNVLSQPQKVTKHKRAISLEVAITDKLTMISGLSSGELMGIDVEGDSLWTRLSMKEAEYTTFDGISVGAKYRLIDARDDLSLSIYGNYERLSFNTPSLFDSDSQEVTAGIITGYQSSNRNFVSPSLALFYTGTFNDAKSTLGNVPLKREIYCVGSEANIMFQGKRAFLIAGIGIQQRLGEMREFGDYDFYSYFRYGYDILSGLEREFKNIEADNKKQ